MHDRRTLLTFLCEFIQTEQERDSERERVYCCYTCLLNLSLNVGSVRVKMIEYKVLFTLTTSAAAQPSTTNRALKPTVKTKNSSCCWRETRTPLFTRTRTHTHVPRKSWRSSSADVLSSHARPSDTTSLRKHARKYTEPVEKQKLVTFQTLLGMFLCHFSFLFFVTSAVLQNCTTASKGSAFFWRSSCVQL